LGHKLCDGWDFIFIYLSHCYLLAARAKCAKYGQRWYFPTAAVTLVVKLELKFSENEQNI